MRSQLKTSVAAWVLAPCLAWVGLGLAGCGQKGPLTLPPASSAASAPQR